MGESLADIRTRMDSTKRTSQITNAMRMVSSVKMTHALKAKDNYQVYADKIREITTCLTQKQLKNIAKYADDHGDSDASVKPHTDISQFSDDDYYSLLIQRPVKKTAFMLITSDKGLAGGYNSQVVKETLEFIEQHDYNIKDIVLFVIGGKGIDLVKNHDVEFRSLRGLSDQPSFKEVSGIVKETVLMYEEEVFDELYVCYNHHVNSLVNQFNAVKMLPIENLDYTEAIEYDQEYILEPSAEDIIGVLLRQYAESLIYGAVLDAKTAEHAARINAMRKATDNANDIVNGLSTKYNRVRQAMITQQITEIVGGSSVPD